MEIDIWIQNILYLHGMYVGDLLTPTAYKLLENQWQRSFVSITYYVYLSDLKVELYVHAHARQC